MKWSSLLAVVTVGLMSASSHGQAAVDAGVPMCPNDGFISERLVPTAHVAKEIYRAVARGLYPNVFWKYSVVIAVDEGDHWEMSQSDNAPPPKPIPATVIVSAGGGQLNLDIDKCTGAISHAALNR